MAIFRVSGMFSDLVLMKYGSIAWSLLDKIYPCEFYPMLYMLSQHLTCATANKNNLSKASVLSKIKD